MSVLDVLAQRLAARTPVTASAEGRREAAVAVVLAPGPDQLLLIRRAEHPLDPWSGQMGLPGGRREPGDVDLLATAIRETWEELGMLLDRAALVGELDDLAPSTPLLPPVVVRPHVFLLSSIPERLVLSPEVQYARWTPLDEIRREGVYGPYDFQHRGVAMSRPAYHLGPDVVWGMTERIVTAVLRWTPTE